MSRISAVVVVVAAVSGCTTFSFKTGGKGSAPDDLKDRAKMVSVPASSFDMGTLTGEPDEVPRHKVELSRFLIDKQEVTLGDYKRCVESRTCKEPYVAEEILAAMDDTHPVTGVSWYDAKKYCEWVGKRLPTEAEWELAARAPKWGQYPFEGAYGPTLLNGRGGDDGYDRTAPVGSFPKGASGLGLLDMAGNAAEWTNDWYEATYYSKSPAVNPKGPEAPTGSKVVRGGSWSDPEHLTRSLARQSSDPNTSNDAVGFRCAADAG